MARMCNPSLVKPFVGVLTGFPDLLPQIKQEFVRRLGEIDLESQLLPFEFTDYYRQEMGSGLKRKFYSFKQLMPPDALADLKVLTNSIEEKFAKDAARPESSDARQNAAQRPAQEPDAEPPKPDVARPVNLDPGYVSLSKVVLASTKDYSHRLYLNHGIYAEVTLRFTKGAFEPWPWTFPDYRQESYLSFFNQVRAALKSASEL